MEFTILFIIFLLSILLFFFLFSLIVLIGKMESKAEKRLKKYINQINNSHESTVKKNKRYNNGRTFFQQTGSFFDGKFKVASLERQLRLAGFDMGPGELLIRTGCLLFLLSALVFAVFQSVIINLIVLAIGFILPKFILGIARKKSSKIATQQLIQAIGIMANSLRAGYSFMQVMKLATEEFPAPLGKEFKKVLENINLGVSLEEAFKQLQESFESQDLDMVLTSILIQRESGGDLAKLLDSVQETMISRVRVKDEVRTLTAQGKLSMWVIMLVPVGLAIYLQAVNPEYFNLLFQHVIGWVMLMMALLGVILGWIIINKIVDIEV